MANKKRYLIFAFQLAAAAALAAVDQVVKSAVVSNIKGKDDIILLKNILALSYAENTGAAFSAFSDSTMFLSVATLVMIVAVLLWMFFSKTDSKIVAVCVTMIVGGGVGNLVDRFAQGYVVDYIKTLFVDFPVYNFADILVTVGVIILIIYLIYEIIQEEKLKKPQSEDNESGAA